MVERGDGYVLHIFFQKRSHGNHYALCKQGFWKLIIPKVVTGELKLNQDWMKWMKDRY